jgi:hypothetical protein
MIISHEKKFIFIHNYKVAGTSMRNALNPFKSPNNFRAASYPDKLRLLLGIYPRIYSRQFPDHIKAAELKKHIPAWVFQQYFKFGFVRNPWDWQVSWYQYVLKLESHHQHQLIKSMKDFDEYIDWRVHQNLELQKSFFYEGDTCLMDFIGKLENLETDFRTISQHIRIDANLPHLNASRNDNDFLKHYSRNSFEMVAQAFAEDLRLFGYAVPEFGG